MRKGETMKKEEIAHIVTEATMDIYEALAPQLIQLIEETKNNTELTDGEKSDEILLHMVGYVKSCTNQIIIESLTKILGDDEHEHSCQCGHNHTH